LGLGALRVFQSIPELKFIIVAVGLTMGGLEVLAFMGLKRKHVPNSFADRIRESLKKAANPFTAFIAGVLVSLLLLPCTSGSYFVALDLLAKNATFAGGLLLLTLYNAIVVLPFVVLTIAIYMLTFRTAKVRVWLDTNEKWLRLFGGVTLIFISLILVL
jgi:cytochrome c biogenesis protein CcdA